MTDQDPTQRYEPPTAASQPGVPTPTPSPDAATPSRAPDGMPAFAPAPPPPAVSGTAQPVATAPVAATTSSRARRGRLRWLAVAVVTLLVAGSAAAATLLLTGDSGDPDVLAYTPADSVAYAELRLDLPGSQEAELAKLMSAFPGFDDQAAFPAKLNEALDQLVGKATDGKQSWQNDIDPWFGGQLAVSMGPLPASITDAAASRGLLLASVTDATKAEAWAAALVADMGGTASTSTYNGVTITTVSPPAGAAGKLADLQTAYAVIGPVLAIGDTTSVKAAIDTGGKTGLNTDAQFKTAEASVSGDRLAFAYVDAAALVDGAKGLAGDAASAMPELPAAFQDVTPPWGAAALSAQNGSFVVETRSPHVSKLGPASVSTSTLPSVLPPTTVLLAEGHDVGQALTRFKDLVTSVPEAADGAKQLDDALQIVGGWDAIVGWMGEAGIAVTRDGDSIGGGIVVVPTDKAAADRLLTQLRGFLALAGGSSGITVTDEAYGDTTITVIGLGGIGGLAGAATGGTVDVPSDLSISYAVTDNVVVIGVGTDFTKAVLDASKGDSLATSSRFTAAMGQVDAQNAGLFWVDVASIRDLIEAQVPADQKADYEANAKPYLQAFDSVIGTYAPSDDLDRGTVSIHVTEH